MSAYALHRRWGGSTAICAALVLFASPVFAEEDPDAGWERPRYQRVKDRAHARPLVLPKRTFDVFVLATIATPSQTEQSFLRLPIEERYDTARLSLATGALFGVTNDLEAGLTFPPMLFDKGIVFSGPVAQFTWRFVDTEAFEVGLTGASILPIAQVFSLEARVPMFVRLSDSLRLSAEPALTALMGKRRNFAVLNVPVTLSAQLAETVFARGTVGISSLAFETLAMSAGAEVGVTIPGDYGAFCDVAVGLRFPNFVDGGAGTRINVEHWAITLSGHFFVGLPQDRKEPGGDL